MSDVSDLPLQPSNAVAANPTRMSRPNDARALRSRKALQAALLRLIENRAFDQITIGDIVREAKVSYPVFYRRYVNKEQLLDDIAAAEVNHLVSLCLPMFRSADTEGSIVQLCRYVSDHQILWKRLLTGGAASAMRDEYSRIAREIGSTSPRINPGLPLDLGPGIVASGTFEILSWWLAQDCAYPLRHVVKIINAVIVRAVRTPIVLDSE